MYEVGILLGMLAIIDIFHLIFEDDLTIENESFRNLSTYIGWDLTTEERELSLQITLRGSSADKIRCGTKFLGILKHCLLNPIEVLTA